MLTVDSWVDLEGLKDPVNGEDSVLERGFAFGSAGSGMKFPVGTFDLDGLLVSNAGKSGSRPGKITKRLLLCKVAIGRAYNAADDFAKIAAIPDGYDSFVVDKEIGKEASVIQPEDDEAKLPESFEFIVKDCCQVRNMKL